MTPRHEIIPYADKSFCKETCKSKFVSENMVKCERQPPCTADMFLKKEGVPRLGRWFCTEECCEKDTEIARIMNEAQNIVPEEGESDLSEEVEVDL